jgi:rhodanese-related sulfurtransferase
MAMNAAFDDGIRAAAEGKKKLVLLCRSGVRSISAAKRATELGVEAYNILEGFEGNPDEQGHRGQIGGWRKRGLPWKKN